MNQIKLNQLAMLVAVVDAGSFSAAAIALGCTQSRISHALAELEQTIGQRLLIRTRVGCSLTDAGQQIVGKARQMLALADSMTGIGSQAQGISGHLRLACFRSVGTHLLPHSLELLARDYPALRVDLNDACEYEDVIAALESGNADIGITRMTPQESYPHLRCYPYLHDAYVLVLPATLNITMPPSWQQLASLPFIQPNNTGARWILDHCRASGFTQTAARRLTNDSAIMALITRGLGFSIFPQLATIPEPAGIRIAALPVPANRQLMIIMRPDIATTPAANILLKCLRDKRVLMETDVCRNGIVGFDY